MITNGRKLVMMMVMTGWGWWPCGDDDRMMMTMMMTGWWWRWWWPGGDICQLFITTLTLADSGVRSVSQPARRLICAMMMPGLGNDRNTWSWSCLIYICEKLQAGRSWLELVQYHPGWCWYRVVRKLLCKAPWVQIGWNYHGMCTVHFSHIIHIWISDTRNIYKYSSKTGMCAVSLMPYHRGSDLDNFL